MNKLSLFAILAAATILGTGCSSTKGGAGMVGYDSNVKYGDAKAVETLTDAFGSPAL